MTVVAEIVTFRLAKGHDDRAFIRAAADMDAFLKGSGGMIRRTLSADDQGMWTDHILWETMDHAENAARQIDQHPDCREFVSMIDGPSVQMRHATVHMQME